MANVDEYMTAPEHTTGELFTLTAQYMGMPKKDIDGMRSALDKGQDVTEVFRVMRERRNKRSAAGAYWRVMTKVAMASVCVIIGMVVWDSIGSSRELLKQELICNLIHFTHWVIQYTKARAIAAWPIIEWNLSVMVWNIKVMVWNIKVIVNNIKFLSLMQMDNIRMHIRMYMAGGQTEWFY